MNFRDEKTLLGTGEAQVRTAAANRIQPAVTVAAYAFLWLAALQLNEKGERPEHLHPPKWRRPKAGADPAALTTGDLGRALRCELWSDQLDPQSFSHFTSSAPADANAQKPQPSLSGAMLTAA